MQCNLRGSSTSIHPSDMIRSSSSSNSAMNQEELGKGLEHTAAQEGDRGAVTMEHGGAIFRWAAVGERLRRHAWQT